MRKLCTTVFLAVLFLFTGLLSQAQSGMGNEPVQMASGLRSNGKIYVVVAVIVTILSIVLAYLIHLDRKIGKLEEK